MAVATRSRQENAPNFTTRYNVAQMTRPKGLTFDEMWESFAESRRAGLYGAYKANRPKSILSYKQDLLPFFAFLAEKKHEHWNDVPQELIQKYIVRVQDGDYTQNSKSHIFRSLKALSNWIDLDPKCQKQQMQSFRRTIPRIQKGKTLITLPTPEVMQKFWRGFKASGMMWDFRDYVSMAIMLDCGPRQGEIRYLRLEHLKLEEDIILIPEEGKTDTRLVHIHPDTTALIEQWLKIRSRFAKREYVFINDDGGRMGETGLPQSFKRNRERTGIEGITPHTVRHFFATHFLVNGGSLPALKAILGHTSYETLKIYEHLAGQITHVKQEHRKASPMAKLNHTDFGTTKVKKKRNTLGD